MKSRPWFSLLAILLILGQALLARGWVEWNGSNADGTHRHVDRGVAHEHPEATPAHGHHHHHGATHFSCDGPLCDLPGDPATPPAPNQGDPDPSHPLPCPGLTEGLEFAQIGAPLPPQLPLVAPFPLDFPPATTLAPVHSDPRDLVRCDSGPPPGASHPLIQRC